MKALKNFLWFIVLISPLVIFHELAHLVVGKMLGLNPTTFSIGFGPEVISFNWQDIVWKISALPLGGYVQFPDETALGIGSGDPWSWFWVAIVGPVANLVLAVVMIQSFFIRLYSNLEVVMVKEELMMVGRFKSDKFFSPNLSNNYYKIIDNNIYPLSLMEAFSYKIEDRKQKLPFTEVLKMALLHSKWLFLSRKDHTELVKLLKSATIKNEIESSDQGRGFVGPLGIAKMLGDAVSQSWGRVVLLSSSLSISLAIFNLLPLSVLDGGKALQAIIQVFTGPNQGLGSTLFQVISFAIVLVFILASFVGDIWSIFQRRNKKN